MAISEMVTIIYKCRNKGHSLIVLMLAVMVLCSTPNQAQQVNKDPRVLDAINLLDCWIDAQREYEQFPGISIAVVYDQTLIWSAGFGYSDLETKRPALPETMYSICSISKLFTCIGAMQLRDLGMFALEDPLSSVLPWFKLKNDTTDERTLTIKTLLTHTAGFGMSIGKLPNTAPYLYYPSREEFKALLMDEKLFYCPGEHYNYSNVGMALVGEIISESSGRLYTRYIREEILNPLNMLSTVPDIGEILGSERLATGYGPLERGGGRTKVGQFRCRGMIPAMGFASTVKDLAKFASWQFRLLEKGGSEILNANTLREMYRVQYVDPSTDVATGFGFSIYYENDKTFVGHGGDCPGYRSDLYIQPEERIATIAMTNAMIPVWEFTARAYEIIAPAINAAIKDPRGGKNLSDDLFKYVGTYDGFPWSGEIQIIPWQGSLAIVRFPIENPMEVLKRLKYLGNQRFQEVREDGMRSMDYIFETDSTGQVLRMITNNYPRSRIK